jgi:hypothetical protein
MNDLRETNDKNNRNLDQRIKDFDDKAIHVVITIALSIITATLTTLAWMQII